MSRYRAWSPGSPEPEDFLHSGPSPFMAAAEFVQEHPDLDIDQLEREPVEVLVRSKLTGKLTRVLVTAAKEIKIWGYPAERKLPA